MVSYLPCHFVTLNRVADVRYAVEDPPVPLAERLEKLLTEKILPNATEPFEDPFRNVVTSLPFRTFLVHKRLILQKGFHAFAVMDPDMSFHTMSLKEWGAFVDAMGLPGSAFSRRQSRNTFWRAQGAFDNLSEREEFIDKLGGNEDNVSPTVALQSSAGSCRSR